MPIEIEISDTQSHMKVCKTYLKQIIHHVLLSENYRDASISLALVDNDTIHRLNIQHLGHDWPTDVITFPLSDSDESAVSGELVISTEMAVTTASEMGAEPRGELALYLIHGLLHLCGYDDSNDSELVTMNNRQSELLEAVAGLRAE